MVTNPLQAAAGGSWLGALLANGSTVALAREDRIRGNPRWVSEAPVEPPYGHPPKWMLGIQARSRAAQRRPDCRHTLCWEGSSGTTWRWRIPGGAPPEAIAGDGEFLGTRAGDFDRCERPQRERRCVGNPSRTIATNSVRDSQMVDTRRKPQR